MNHYLGIDIGSSSSKAVIIDEQGSLVGRSIINLGIGSEGPDLALEGALRMAGIQRSNVSKTVATGYGRLSFDSADKTVTEISCHARGVKHFVPSVRTLIDVGGQDAKVIRILENGRIGTFVMNDKCAAGTGRFLDVMSRVFGVGLEQLSELASAGSPGVNISNTCTVFAESEVISQLAKGKKRVDVAYGVVKSIAEKIGGLARRVGVEDDVVMSGGVALNQCVIDALQDVLDKKVIRLQDPQGNGAIGAALYALDMDRNPQDTIS